MGLDIVKGLKKIYSYSTDFFEPLRSLPFKDSSTEKYGSIRADLSTQGRIIGPNDLMIAAIALANDAVLVTHNNSEFSRISGLRLVDWQV